MRRCVGLSESYRLPLKAADILDSNTQGQVSVRIQDSRIHYCGT